jgi:predicted O-methyltransferase YrrM
MLSAVEFSHALLRERLFAGDVAVDATAGNGHDTHFLAQLTGEEGRVFAFDVQGEAITATRQLLERWGVPKSSWELIHAGHETLAEKIPQDLHGRIGGVLFNLGYLPGSDKSVITRAETTVMALRAALRLLRPGGIIVIVLYTGHAGGAEEAQAVRDWAQGLPPRETHVIEYRALNTRHPAPEVIAIEASAHDAEPEYMI